MPATFNEDDLKKIKQKEEQWHESRYQSRKERLVFDAGVRQEVSFGIVKNFAGKYEVDVNGLVGSFLVREAAVEPVTTTPETPLPTPTVKRFNWWLIGGIAAAIVVLGIVVWQLVIRRKPS